MKSSMKELIKGKTTENLKERKKELYKRILSKQKLINRYKHLVIMAEGNCSEFVREYEIIDRVIFFREDKVKILPASGKREQKKIEPLVKKDIRIMTKEEQTTLLKQLLEIRERRQSEQTSA